MPRVVDGTTQPGPANISHVSILKSPTTPRSHSKHVPINTGTEYEVTATEIKRNAAIQVRRRHRRFSPGRIDPDYIALHNASLALDSQSADAVASTETENRKRQAPGPAFSRAKRLQLLASSHDTTGENATSPRRLDFKGNAEMPLSQRQNIVPFSGESNAEDMPLNNQFASELNANDSFFVSHDGQISVSDQQVAMDQRQSAKYEAILVQGQPSSAFRSFSNSLNSVSSSIMLSTPEVSVSGASGPNFAARPCQGIRRHSWRQMRAAVANKQIPFATNSQPIISSISSLTPQPSYEPVLSNVAQAVAIQPAMPSFYSAASESVAQRASYPWRQLRHAVTNRFTPMYRQMTQTQHTVNNNVYSGGSQGQQVRNNRVYPGGAPAASTLSSLQQTFQPDYYTATAGGEVADADSDAADDESGSSMSDCAPGPSTIDAVEFGQSRALHSKRPAAIVSGIQLTHSPSSPLMKASGVVYARQVASIETQTVPVFPERSDACVQTDVSVPLYPFASFKRTTSSETQTDAAVCLRMHRNMVSATTETEDYISCEINLSNATASPPRNSVSKAILFLNKLRPWTQS